MTQALASLDIPQFSSQIDELNQLLLEFQALLETESTLLKKSDATALSSSTQTKSLVTEKIDILVNEINNNLPKNSISEHFFELADKKMFSDISTTLQNQVDKTMSLTQSCHDLNMANGMAIQILTNINQVSLQILTGQTQADANLYGASGVTTQNKSKSSLGKA